MASAQDRQEFTFLLTLDVVSQVRVDSPSLDSDAGFKNAFKIFRHTFRISVIGVEERFWQRAVRES